VLHEARVGRRHSPRRRLIGPGLRGPHARTTQVLARKARRSGAVAGMRSDDDAGGAQQAFRIGEVSQDFRH
jgi:hypothetical protein